MGKDSVTDSTHAGTNRNAKTGSSEDPYEVILWSDELEAMLKKWGEQAKGLAWMHTKCDKWFGFFNKMIGLPAGVLSVGLSVAIAGTQDNTIAKWIYAGVAICAGMLIFIQNYLRFGERSALHGAASVQYQIFANDIEAELSLDRSSRQPGKRFFKSMKHRLTALTVSRYPAILDRYVTEYNIRLFNSSVSRPVIAGSITEIQVNQNQGDNEKSKDHDPLDTIIIDKMIESERNNPAIQHELKRFQRNSSS